MQDLPARRRRELLKALLAAAALPPGASARAGDDPFDAVVGAGAPADARRFRSVAAAIAAAPVDATRPWRIRIGAGTWHEKLVIERANVHLVGVGRDSTRLRFDAAAGENDPSGQPWGTWGCASLRVRAPGFVARALSIENGFDYLGHLRAPKLETIGANGAQAVALMLDAGSDRAIVEDCRIVGHQDTLFIDAGRAAFRRCTIEGSVDFVFGAGQALIEDCRLVSRHRPGKSRQGYVAAPSTPRARATGLVFHRCDLVAEPQVARGSVALGRAWRPTRTLADGRYGDPDALGAAAFIACRLGAHIAPEGWDAMNYSARDGTRIALEAEDARFAEYANRGPGARLHARRRQLSAQQAHALLAACGSGLAGDLA